MEKNEKVAAVNHQSNSEAESKEYSSFTPKVAENYHASATPLAENK